MSIFQQTIFFFLPSRVTIPTFIQLAVVLGLALSADPAASSADAGSERRGLWLLPRKDAGNTGRADLPGDFKTAPREVWSYGSTQPVYRFLGPVKVAGTTAYLGQVGG